MLPTTALPAPLELLVLELSDTPPLGPKSLVSELLLLLELLNFELEPDLLDHSVNLGVDL